MVSILDRKVSTGTGLAVIFIVAVFFGYIMIDKYQKLMQMRFEQINTELER